MKKFNFKVLLKLIVKDKSKNSIIIGLPFYEYYANCSLKVIDPLCTYVFDRLLKDIF